MKTKFNIFCFQLPSGALISSILLCFLSWNLVAQQQTLSIKGQIVDISKTPLPGAVVEIGDMVAVADPQGNFSLTVSTSGNYILRVRLLGYETLEQTLSIQQPIDKMVLELKEQELVLGETVIYGKSAATEVREQAIKTAVIDLQEAYTQPASLSDLINRSPGVRIRQTGGLGSTTDISLNGFQGKSVRYFKDGVPMDYLGEGFPISSIPVNMLERVEVYKGVLPVALGSDALGGAVNLISRTPKGRFAEAAYEIASYNTHRFNFNSYYSSQSGEVFAGLDGFFNHSDNDYKAIVKVTDPDTKNQTDRRLPLFHNAYTGYFLQGYTGIQNKSWTDLLRLELSLFEINREQQHPALMTDPYGAIKGRQHSLVPAVRYQKKWDKVSIDQFLVYNNLVIHRTDTIRGQYDWFGHFTPRPDRPGESRQPALSTIDNHNFTSRTNFHYSLTEQHALELNTVYTRADRKGRDPYGPKFSDTDIDVLSLPSSYNKLVSALGWQAFSQDKKWSNLLMLKYFGYSSSGVETWQARPIFTDETSSVSGNSWGIGNALKYQPQEWNLFRFSAEYATRLPDQMELFGNGIWVVQNFQLNAEKSLNVNLGMRRSVPGKYTLEANTFYRITRDMILLVPIQAPYARYENQENVRGFGVELDGDLVLDRRWRVNANLTWQELTLFGIENPTDRWKNGARLRNTPYMFANAGLNYRPQLPGDKVKLSIYAFYNVMREFYLETIPAHLEPKGLFGSASVNTMLIIPTQHLVHTGISLSLPQQKLTLGAEVKNLLDTDQYDNYRVQRAGRSLHFKINYLINQDNN